MTESSDTKQLDRRVIERVERLNNSRNGNPRFRFYFADGLEADLQSDASFGYEAENPEYRPGSLVDVSFTRAGLVKYMRPVARAKRVTVKVAVIDERCMVDESTAVEFTRDSAYPAVALRQAMEEAEAWMCRRQADHGNDSFDLTVAL